MTSSVDERTHPAGSVLAPYHDEARIRAFCLQDAMRYRHILHYLGRPPWSDWDKAMFAYYPSGVSETTPPAHYAVERDGQVGLLADIWDRRVRIEGDARLISLDGLRAWWSCVKPIGVGTTSEELSELLSHVVGDVDWSANFYYTVTADTFLEHTAHEVVRLSPADRDSFDRFLERPSDVPFLNLRRSNDNLARDLLFLYNGIPVDGYAVRVGPDIAGIVTTFILTDSCDEISRLYVAREYRGRGIGRSLLSAATREILMKGRQPSFAVGGDPNILDRLLCGLGYRVFSRFWHWRFWWDMVELKGKGASR